MVDALTMLLMFGLAYVLGYKRGCADAAKAAHDELCGLRDELEMR